MKSNNRVLAWAGRLALIPLGIYALGTPLALFHFRAFELVADNYLPYEIVGLFCCLCLAILGHAAVMAEGKNRKVFL